MAGEENKSNYELRRASRGPEPEITARSWKRRLWTIGIVLGTLLIVGGSYALWYHVAHIYTKSARVRAAVVELSPEISAPVLELLVDDGDAVTAGQVLARLDDSELRAALDASEANRAIREATYRQAEAQLNLASARVKADIAMATARVTVAEARVGSLETELGVLRQRLPEQIRRAEALYEEEVANLKKLKAGPREEEIEAAKARIESAKAYVALYELEVKQSKELVDEGIDSQYILEARKTRLSAQHNALREAELELQQLEAGPRPEDLEAAEKSVEGQAASLAIAKMSKLEEATTQATLEIRRAELTEARAALTQARSRADEVLIAEQEMKAAMGELKKAEAELAGRRAALAAAEIITPVAGTVTRTFHEVGELCRAGSATIIVREAETPRWIEGFVDEKDAMLLDVGQVASVRVPASSRNRIRAKVFRIGLHTETLDGGGGIAPRFGQPDRVWLMLAPEEPLDEALVTGTTARVVIRVR